MTLKCRQCCLTYQFHRYIKSCLHFSAMKLKSDNCEKIIERTSLNALFSLLSLFVKYVRQSREKFIKVGQDLAKRKVAKKCLASTLGHKNIINYKYGKLIFLEYITINVVFTNEKPQYYDLCFRTLRIMKCILACRKRRYDSQPILVLLKLFRDNLKAQNIYSQS